MIFRSIPLLHGIGMDNQPRLLSALSEMLEQGAIRPLLDPKRFSFARIAEAHRHIESGRAVGKILLEH